LCLIIELNIAEELARFRKKEDGVRHDALLLECGLQLGPDGTMASFVFGFLTRVHAHYESLADDIR